MLSAEGPSLETWAYIATIIAAIIAVLSLLLRSYKHRNTKPKLKPIIHRPDSDLTGRDTEIKEIRDHFTFSRMPLVIHGGPGVGKTVLARKLAHDHYKDRWVMLPLSSDSEMKRALEPIAQQLNIEDRGDIAGYILSTLNAMRTSRGRWLIILDNADSDDEAERARRFTGDTNDLDFIITSQRSTWPDTIKPYPLSVLSPDDAAALLSKLSGRKVNAGLKALAKDLDYLPLALTLIGADLAIQPATMPLKTYIEKFSDLLDKAPENSHYKKSVATAVLLAFDRLGEAAQAMLNIAAFMDPNDIDMEYFTRGATGITQFGYDPLPQPLWAAAQDKIKMTRIMAEAQSHALLYRATIFDMLTRRIHRTTQSVLRRAMGDEGRGLNAGLAARLGDAPISGNAQYDTDSWPLYHRLAPHLEALLPLIAQENINIAGDDIQRMAYFGNQIGIFLDNATGDKQRCLDLQQAVLPIFSKAHGEKGSDYAAALSNLAGLQDDVARLEDGEKRKQLEIAAETNHKAAMKIKQDIAGAELSLAVSHNNLGSFYHARQKVKDAETHLKKALELKLAYGASDIDLGTAYGNLGGLYSDLADQERDSRAVQNQRKKVLEYKLKALNYSQKGLGECQLSTGIRLYNLAIEYNILEQFEVALTYAVRAAAIPVIMLEQGDIRDPNHPYLIKFKTDLEIFLKTAGRDPAQAGALIAAAKPHIIKDHEQWKAAQAAGEPYEPPLIAQQI